MQRRRFIRQLTVASAALGGGLLAGCRDRQDGAEPAAVASKKQYRWKLTTTWPPNFPIFQEGVQRFAEDVKTMSGGRLSIQVYAGGELVPALQSFDAVSQGTVEMGHGAGYYWAGKIPAAQFFTAVPFGMNAQGMHAWMYAGGGLELYQEVYRPFNLVPFPVGNSGVQMGGWFNKRIDSVADLKGLKMRIPGLGGKVMAKAGVNPVLLPGAEIYTALERKTLDAAEWVGPYHDERLGLHRAAQYYYYPGWHEPGPMLELIINLKAWESLTDDLRLIVQTAAIAINTWMFAEFEARNHQSLRTLREQFKVQILEFPPEVLRALKRHTQEVLDEEAAKDATFKRVYEAYEKFRREHDAWAEISEESYARARKL
ncbi:MAG TPA: TRAP transporter substrate-binding protein DctP [Acidiferrobacterales bacterium]